MQPDYSRLLYNISNDGQASDAHFYNFFEDSLNQFISANSSGNQQVALKSTEQQKENNKEEL